MDMYDDNTDDANVAGGTNEALVLERRDETDRTIRAGATMISPELDEDYWQYRVVVGERQAIVGFPKFGTIGVGLAVEDDWNTNLPAGCPAEQIWEHIRHNKGDGRIPDERCLAAIRMVQDAARADGLISDVGSRR